MIKIQDEIQFEPFAPIWWAPEVHSQTIFASFSTIADVQPERIQIETPDDDFLELDVLIQPTSTAIVVLFHGLEGSSRRHYIRNLMHALSKHGISSIGVNFRGCGDTLNIQRRMYHSGATEDYHTVFKWVREKYPDLKIHTVGFSLGANALVKYLAETNQNNAISKAVAVSPPYSLKAGSLKLNQGLNRVYQYKFLRTLVQKAQLKKQQFADFPTFSGSTLYDFDDQVTAPVHGFKNAEDYYEQCSSSNFYAQIKTPLLLIHSKVDSVCPFDFAPLEDIHANAHIHPIFTEQGGHVGFLSKKEGWLNRVILKWLLH